MNVKFNERHHAFISSIFFKKLRDIYGDKGIAAFILATQRYGEQRGSRMAQRAIADGRNLDFRTYCEYSEWSYTDDYKNEYPENSIVVTSYTPDYEYSVYDCPWYKQYKDMGLLDGGKIYCEHIDLSIVRGFNPNLNFQIKQHIYSSNNCTFCLKNANLKDQFIKDKEQELTFEYHCAHALFTYSEIIIGIFKTQGYKISTEVIFDFADKYGFEYANRLINYRNCNFNVIP